MELGSLTRDDVISRLTRAMDRRSVANAGEWAAIAISQAEEALRAYALPAALAAELSALALGVIEQESRFGRGPRYALKAISVLGAEAIALRLPAPRSIGLAQIDRGRLTQLGHESEVDLPSLRLLHQPVHALQFTALGLAKAVGLYAEAPAVGLGMQLARAIVLTHQAGWMTPRNAAVQMMLSETGFFPPGQSFSGFVGRSTLSAIERLEAEEGLVRSLGSPGKSEGTRLFELRRLLADPARSREFDDSPLLASLTSRWTLVTGTPGLRWTEPVYGLRKPYTGWITSRGYAAGATRIASEVVSC